MIQSDKENMITLSISEYVEGTLAEYLTKAYLKLVQKLKESYFVIKKELAKNKEKF